MDGYKLEDNKDTGGRAWERVEGVPAENTWCYAMLRRSRQRRGRERQHLGLAQESL